MMPQLILHFIDARKQLAEIEGWVFERLQDTFKASAKLLPLLDTDVVVQAGKSVLPESGHVGYAPEKGVIYITIDPQHSQLRSNPRQSLERMFAHELHHSARWDGPGYGKTLGEALVSEGLAGHFVQELFGGEPEIWESLPVSILGDYVNQARDDWSNPEYEHDKWFFGQADLPRWLGYSLGCNIVGRYLKSHFNSKPSSLVHMDAQAFRIHIDEIS